MKDKYGNEIKVGDEVAFAFYDGYNCECFIQKAPIKSIDEENHSVTLDVRGTGILDSSEYEDGSDEDGNPIYLEEWYDFRDDIILVKRKEEK